MTYLLIAFLVLAGAAPQQRYQPRPLPPSLDQLPRGQQPYLHRESSSRILFAKILEAEDRREFSKALVDMLDVQHAGVRSRAALALGRIGSREGMLHLLSHLTVERKHEIQADIAFALGEIEDHRAVSDLYNVFLNPKNPTLLRARAIEALGKIAANPATAPVLAQKKAGQVTMDHLAAAAASALPPPDRVVAGNDLLLASLATTALLRIRNSSAIAPLTAQLASRNVELRWRAANALARLRPEPAAAAGAVAGLTAQLKDADPVVRATAARALGAVKGTSAAPALLPLVSDPDQRAAASAVRTLGVLGDARAVEPLGALGERLLAAYRAADKDPGTPDQHNLLMLVAEALGQLKAPASLPLLQRIRSLDGHAGANPETETAVAAFGEEAFFAIPGAAAVPAQWYHVANYAQGLGALGGERAKRELVDMLAGKRFGALDPRSVPDALAAVSKLKVEGLEQVLIDRLKDPDFYVRATAAGLLAEHFAPSQSEATWRVLEPALDAAAADRETDARLGLLDAISKFERPRAKELLSKALNDRDYVVRRKAADLLTAAGEGSFETKVSSSDMASPHPRGFYEGLEAAMRLPNPVAVVATDKGEIRMELLIREAPVTAQNFVDLARKGYFNGVAFHRVVPNFVVQGGDPRGDGNGGPGYQIRCEINMAPYDRGAVGMALSGKDTGGSQFFFTHAPQPHLDGGYTVFARVTGGMDVVDRLARGDRILSVSFAGQ